MWQRVVIFIVDFMLIIIRRGRRDQLALILLQARSSCGKLVNIMVHFMHP